MKEPIIIPSKNIFYVENQKVIDNAINGVSFSSSEVVVNKQKEIFSLYQIVLYEGKETGDYTEYTEKFNEINSGNINFSGKSYEYNGYPSVEFKISINSTNFIHIPSIKFDLNLHYLYGTDYTQIDSEAEEPSLQVNQYIKKIPTFELKKASVGVPYKTTGTVFDIYVPSATITTKLSTYDEKSKSFNFYITLPLYYNSSKSNPNPLMSGQSVIFTDFSLNIFADEIEFQTVDINTGLTPRATINSNELFQEFSENGIGDQPKGVYLSLQKFLLSKIF